MFVSAYTHAWACVCVCVYLLFCATLIWFHVFNSVFSQFFFCFSSSVVFVVVGAVFCLNDGRFEVELRDHSIVLLFIILVYSSCFNFFEYSIFMYPSILTCLCVIFFFMCIYIYLCTKYTLCFTLGYFEKGIYSIVITFLMCVCASRSIVIFMIKRFK